MHRIHCNELLGLLLVAIVGMRAPGQYAASSGQPPGVMQADVPPVAVHEQAPFEPLNPQFQEFLDKVLEVWQQKTSNVERFRCDFNRFQFDPALNANGHYSVATGELKYLKPDKGLFRIDNLEYFAGLDDNNQPLFRSNARTKFGEYWICDGLYVQILDRNEKKCTKIELPPQMRGKQIYLSPLPFLFGVNAQDIKNRFWIRPLTTPTGRTNEVWLEAWPKTVADAQNYSRVQIILDTKDVLPKGLIVYLPNWRPDAMHRELYEFQNREINPKALGLNPFAQAFIPDQLPKDWKVIVEPFQDQLPPDGAQRPAVPVQPRVAQPPLNSAAPLR